MYVRYIYVIITLKNIIAFSKISFMSRVLVLFSNGHIYTCNFTYRAIDDWASSVNSFFQRLSKILPEKEKKLIINNKINIEMRRTACTIQKNKVR